MKGLQKLQKPVSAVYVDALDRSDLSVTSAASVSGERLVSLRLGAEEYAMSPEMARRIASALERGASAVEALSDADIRAADLFCNTSGGES